MLKPRFITYFVCFIASLSIVQAASRPVVIIPGIMGSKLCDGSGNILWCDRASYTYSRIRALRLPFTASDRDATIHSCGLIDNIVVVPLLWESDVYSGLLSVLKGPDFEYRDDDILQFHYDWRLSNYDNAVRLRKEIEERWPDSSRRVDIVAHSMGGLIARIYVQSLDGEARVQNLLMFGTPHRGSAQIFARLRDGFEKWPNELSGGLTEIQRTVLSFPSTYELLPTYNECCGFDNTGDPSKADYQDVLLPATWVRFNWLPDEYKKGRGARFLTQSLATARRLKALLAEPVFKDPLRFPNLHFIGNGFLDTWSRVFFHPSTGLIVGNTTYKGDGTVLLESATNGDPQQVQISRRDHAHVFLGEEPKLILEAALSDHVWHKGEGDFCQDMIDEENRKIAVCSASLDVEPRVTVPGGIVDFKLSLTGEGSLQTARLSNLRADVLQDTTVILTKSLADSSRSGMRRDFRAQMRAPRQAGAYSVRFTLPGVGTFETAFAIIEP